MKEKEKTIMLEELADLDVIIGDITKPTMKITKIEYENRTSAVVNATIATGLPAAMDIHDVIQTTVGWLVDQGYIQIPDLPDDVDYMGKKKFKKLSDDAIIGALHDDYSASYKKEIQSYLKENSDGNVLISIGSCWLDPTIKSWFVNVKINDDNFSYVPVGA